MRMDKITPARKDEIASRLANNLSDVRTFEVKRIGLFGSVVRDEAGPESDVDFLIEVGSTTSSWFPAGLILDLENLLGRPVEVVTERALNRDLRERVLREAVPV